MSDFIAISQGKDGEKKKKRRGNKNCTLNLWWIIGKGRRGRVGTAKIDGKAPTHNTNDSCTQKLCISANSLVH